LKIKIELNSIICAIRYKMMKVGEVKGKNIPREVSCMNIL
jgi:hypothetical protein